MNYSIKVVDEKDKLTHELEEVERVKNELKVCTCVRTFTVKCGIAFHVSSILPTFPAFLEC